MSKENVTDDVTDDNNENDLFEEIIPVIESTTKEIENTNKETEFTTKEKVTNNVTDDFTVNNSRLKQIIFQINQNKKVAMSELAEELNINKRTIASDIAFLKSEDIITRIGNNKTGFWKLIKNT